MRSAGLVDARAREVIAGELDLTLFVEAGAGSGKTEALVGRIVALLEAGRAPVTGVAAITFTEAAAAELRIRVREELEKRVGAAGGEKAALLAEALAHIDEAPISTIHGFCRRILSAHPVEAGLPPRFEVLDEVSESIEWRRRFAEELDVLATTPGASEVISLGWLLGVTAPRIEALARELDVEWQAWSPPPGGLERALEKASLLAVPGLEALRTAITALVAAKGRCLDEEDRLATRLEELAALGDAVAGADSPLAALEAVVATEPFSSPNRGNQQNWSGDIGEVRRLLAKAQAAHAELRQSVLDEVVAGLAAHFQHRGQLAAEERRRRGVLTFHDLVVFCRRLLEQDGSARDDVRDRFAFVLVDEFQDTDLLQLEIARLIGAVAGRWEEGRFFFVGDPKQSIYSFRGADLAAYESARGEIAGGGALLLSSCFRSVPGVISFVNAAFANLLGERFHALDPVRPPAPALTGPPVCLVGGPMADRPLKAVQREREAEDCCRSIELAVRHERWPVGEDGSSRPARLGDVAILVPRRTGLPELEAALDAHEIPYRVESASLILQSQEVRDLLHLARAIGEPGNELALVATLRSPCYSLGDDELVAWASAGGRWSIEAEPPESARAAAPAVAAALAQLASFRDRLGELGPAGTLSFAVRSLQLLPLAAFGPRAREVWRRIRYILERARLFIEAGGSSLSELADWIDEQLEGGGRSAESVVPEADEDVVRILTVHGAKGLEFPLTFLCGFGTSEESTRPDLLLRHGDGRPEVHFNKELRTSGYGALHLLDQQLEAEEALRLCYVAATRAKDHLVICAHHVAGSRPSLGELLYEAAQPLGGLWRRLPSVLDGEAERPSGSPRLAAAAEVSGRLRIESPEELTAWAARRAELLAGAVRRANVPATEVAALAGLDELPAYSEEAGPAGDEEAAAGLPPSWRRGRAGTRIGRAVHATLQSIALADAAAIAGCGPKRPGAAGRLEEVARAQARAERLDGREAEVARLAAAGLRAETVVAALGSGKAKRELYVATEIGGTVLDGYVDLCFGEADGSLTVVDYKTDSVACPAEAAAKAARYELQAASYAICLEEATGRPVRRCVLVFLSPPRQPLEHEVTGALLQQRKEEVRALVGGLGR